MRSINIETLMGHSLGLSDSYYRPTEEEILEDYLNGTNALTLSNLHEMQEKLEELIVKTEDSDRSTKGQLEEKDQAIVAISDQVMLICMRYSPRVPMTTSQVRDITLGVKE